MPHWLRRTVQCLAIIAIGIFSASPLAAQVKDSLTIISSPNGPYSYCLAITVANRHDSTIRISEFRLRIISGRGAFIDGSSSSPASWTLFQLPSSAAWLSGSQAADIPSGGSLGGFSLCVRDTGVIHIVWETRTLAGIVSSDTLRFAGGDGQCDEAFFRPQPSRASCTFDVDLRAGVIGGRPVTDFHLRNLTPGATFSTLPAALPAGWTRTQARPDLISFHRTQGGLEFREFAEGFRILFAALPDSARVAWWTLTEDNVNCGDTVTLRCQSLTADDTVRIAASDTLGSCCHNVTLVNAHRPGSTIDAFVVQVLTPGITIVADTAVPPSWRRRALNAAGDSLAFSGSLGSGDSTIFRSVCFDNGNIGDTVRYRWSSYAGGVLVSSGTGATLCIRPLVRCDSASIAIAGPATETNQCLTMGVTNQNSRAWPINRIVVTVNNDGTKRRIRSAQAALQGWRVDRFTADSIIYSGGTIPPGGSTPPQAFTFCVSLGDSTTVEPLRVTWHTFSTLGDLCSATVPVQLNDTSGCDSVAFSGSIISSESRCCFDISFANRNGRKRRLDSFALSVTTPGVALTNGGELPIGWGVAWDASGQNMSYHSAAGIAPGMSTPRFTICIDSRALNTPLQIPIIWRTFSDGELICSETIIYTCAPPPVLCDSVQLLRGSSGDVSCLYSYRLVNSHTPGGGLNTVRFEIVDGDGEIMSGGATGGASAWTVLSQSSTSVIFRGPTLMPGAAIDAFDVVIRPTGGRPIVVETCTFSNATQICCSRDTVACATSGVELATGPSGFRLYESQPNPFSGVTTIRYELLRSSSVALRVTDGEGREVRRIERGGQSAGEHAIRLDLSDLPSGVYYYTLQAGAELDTRRMVLVK